MLRTTRAASSWRNAHRLGMLDIPTAKPVAFIENRLGPLRGSSYFIMQAVNGTRADHYFVDNTIPLQVRHGHAEVLLYLFERIAAAGLVHGDYKASNFVVTEHGPVILDLDAMKPAGSEAALQQGLEKDLRRFMYNWKGQAEAEALFREGVAALAAQYGVSLEQQHEA
jgi:RIO-like serine/threonine protein kinase